MKDVEFGDALIAIVKRDVAPALGCTEPISLALATAIAVSHLDSPLQQIQAKVSPNLMKNGMGVTVPGTGMVGLPIAAAAGAIAGDCQAGLEVLKHIQPDDVAQAKQMLAENRVSVDIANVEFPLYSEALVLGDSGWVKVCIQDSHTNVVLIEKNGEVIFEQPTVLRKLPMITSFSISFQPSKFTILRCTLLLKNWRLLLRLLSSTVPYPKKAWKKSMGCILVAR